MNNFKREPFKMWCQKVLPLVYDESLSYYEVLCKLTKVVNDMISNLNDLPDYIESLLSDDKLQDLLSNVLNELREQIAVLNDYDSKTATADRNVGELIWLDGKLYKITRNMLAGDQYFLGSNIEKVSIELELNRLSEKCDTLYKNLVELVGEKYELLVGKINEAVSNLELSIDNTNVRIDNTNERIDDVVVEINLLKNKTLFVTFEDYGAKGDGVTDDTLAIQRAIDAGFSNYQMLEATYVISAPIVLSRGNINIVGYGDNSVIKLKNNCTPKPYSLLVAESKTSVVNNIKLSNFTIDGNRINNVDHGTPDASGNQSKYWSGTLIALVNFTNVDNAVIDNMRLINSWGSAIWLSDCRYCRITNNNIKDYRITGIALRNNTSYSVVESVNNIIDNNICSGGVVGVDCLFGSYNNTITNNQCFNNKDANKFPAYAYNGVYPNVYPNTGSFKSPSDEGYVNPAFLGDGAGIECTGVYTDINSTHIINNVINGNVCVQNMVGVRVEEETEYCSIGNNVCSFNEQMGIEVYSSIFMAINGNTCNNNGTHGIVISKLKDELGVNGSRIVRLVPANNTISGNTMVGNNDFGLVISGGNYNTIDGNIICGNNAGKSSIGGAIGLYSSVENLSDGDRTYLIEYNIITNNIMTNFYGNDIYGIYGQNMGASNVIKDNVNRMPTELYGVTGDNNVQNILKNVPKTLLEPYIVTDNIPDGITINLLYTYYAVIDGVCYVQFAYADNGSNSNQPFFPIADGTLPPCALGNYVYINTTEYRARVDSNGAFRFTSIGANNNGIAYFSYPVVHN